MIGVTVSTVNFGFARRLKLRTPATEKQSPSTVLSAVRRFSFTCATSFRSSALPRSISNGVKYGISATRSPQRFAISVLSAA